MPFNMTRFPCFSRLGLALLAAIAVQLAQAAELGEAVVSSHIGQPLVAEIELVDTAGAVQARNANGDVYRGANIAINPALSGLTLSVQRREGRQFLRLTSARAIDANYLHLFLELVDGGKTVIRPATLWLTPDLSAPPPPPPPPPAQPKPQALAPPVAARTPPVPPPIVDAEPPPPVRKPARVITLGQAGPACPQPMLEQQVQACAANDEKNKALTEQVSSLEAKVKQLQALIDARTGAAPPLATPDAAAVSAAASAASAAATVPAPAPPPKKPVAPPPPAAVKKTEEGGGFPWLLVVGSVLGLAAIGGGAWFWLKRRKAKAGEAPAPQAPPDAPEPD